MTTITKDSTGNVTKVTKVWNDESTTTYTYDPKTGEGKVTEQQDGKAVSEKTIEPGDSNVTLPDGSDVETTVDVGKPGEQPTIEHYTTQHDTDKSNNVTTMTKDSTGNVTKVTKVWNDGSTTTYTYDPATGKGNVTEQKNGEETGYQAITPDSIKLTLPDGEGATSVVTIDPETKEPTIEHYTTQQDVDKSDNVTTTTEDSTGNVTKVTKVWHDGSTTTYTYDPKTGERKVTEQKDGKTVSEQTIAPGDSNVTLSDGSDVETTVDAGQPGAQPTIEHYTTHKDTDGSNNVTTATKDSTGDVTKVIKVWNDGSTTTYTYDPKTGERTVTEQKDGKIVSEQTMNPGDSNVTLPDGDGGTIVVKINESDTLPTITHYPASHNVAVDVPVDEPTDEPANEPTNEPEKTVKITKQWPDGSKIIYTYDPATAKRIIRELRNGYLVEQRTIASGSPFVVLPDGKGGIIIVRFDELGMITSFTRQAADEISSRHSQSLAISNAERARNTGTKHMPVQQESELPQTGQKNEGFWAHLGEILLVLLTVPFAFRRRH
ncbi:hypothetical protein HEQ50_04220 [Lactobacillus sp. ZJLC28-8]|nr:hypothetical protein [Lactobacillus sp. HBUAS51381]